MDLWIVAAATGAGYLAKYWQIIHGEKDAATSDHNHHRFNEDDDDRSQGINRIWDYQKRSANKFGLENLPERNCIWDDDQNQMNIITETSYDGHEHIIDDLLLATKTFHPGIISLTSRNWIKPISTMPPTIHPVLVTDGYRITSVERNKEKEKQKKSQKTSSAAGAERASRVVLFFIGIMIGVMTATKACKGEMDYLGKQLEDSDNLVQDLIDELDMKETITVKELDDDDHQFKSEIETELEAELVRLEIMINIREPMHELDNFDPKEEEDEDHSDYDTRPTNYAVSPKELKLRLYEVLESRLEARIKELEEALEISQAKRG